MPAEPAIRVQRLEKVYHVYDRPSDRLRQALWRGRRSFHREFHALRDLSFEIAPGETFGVVGRNGSGKTTLLQLIAGVRAPTAGEVRVAGRLSLLLSLGTGFDPRLTGRENVDVNASLAGLTQADLARRLDAIRDFAEIGDFLDQPLSSYSTGMTMRLAFALAIHVEPDVLLIDEALAVGDEAFQRKCFARLRALRESGVTIVFVSHSASSVLELCDRALLLDAGERLLLGSPKQVLSRYHRLIFAPRDEAAAIREEIRSLDAGGRAAPALAEAAPPDLAPEPVEGEAFDPDLRPRSTVSYVPRGARVRDVTLVDARGRRANVLRRGGLYQCAYEVEFDAPAHGVRFGMLVKSVTGLELGGVASHPLGAGIPYVAAGTRLRVRIPFRARLLPGSYFVNAGLVGIVDGGEQFLHRLLDAAMFRVALEKNLRVTEIVDFSSDEPARFEVLKPDGSPRDGAVGEPGGVDGG